MQTYKDEDGFDIKTKVIEIYNFNDELVERAVVQIKSMEGVGLMPSGRPGGDFDTPEYDDGFSELSVTVSAGGIKNMTIKGDGEKLAAVYLEFIKGMQSEDSDDLFEKIDNAGFAVTLDEYDGYLPYEKYFAENTIAEPNDFGIVTRLEKLILDDKAINALDSVDLMKVGMQGKEPVRDVSLGITDLLNAKANGNQEPTKPTSKRDISKLKM